MLDGVDGLEVVKSCNSELSSNLSHAAEVYICQVFHLKLFLKLIKNL